MAQRAFRRRQADHLRELRDRATTNSEPQDETIRKLQEENSRLRKSLIDVHAKLSRLTANMQSLSETVSSSIDRPTAQSPDRISNDSSFDLDQILDDFESGAIEDDIVGDSEPSTNPQQMALSLTSPRVRSPTSLRIDLPEESQNREISSGQETISARVSSLAQEIPSIWSFEYQMGTDPYTRALSSNQSSRMIMDKDWTETNSPFSDHIQILRKTLKGKVDLNRPATGPAMLL